MSPDRWVVLGLASVRAPWFRQVTGWAMAGVLPIDFVKCVSAGELVARLRSGRTHSAIVIDGELAGLDRDLLSIAAQFGVSTLVVTAPTLQRDWDALGASSTLEPDFSRNDLLEALQLHATPLTEQTTVEAPVRPTEPSSTGRLIAVIGRTGSGVSTSSMALAQGMADDPTQGGRVLLADLARRADQALLHDAHDIVPGLQELVEAHRAGTPTAKQIRAMTFNVPQRGYDLLLGLRRGRDWTALRPASFEAAIVGLRRAYHVIIADLDDDLEGAEAGGSDDIEDRNLAARHVALEADVVVAIGSPSLVGVRALVVLIDELTILGVDAQRIQPVFTRAPARQRDRADLARTVADLMVTDDRLLVPTPIHIADRRHLDDVHRNGTRLPSQIVDPLFGATSAALLRPAGPDNHSDGREPELVTPGSLGTMASLDDDAS